MRNAETEAVSAFLKRHGLPPYHSIFAGPVEIQLTLMSSIARGEVGPDFPQYPMCPTGRQARILCQAVGVPPGTLRTSLSLGQDLFDRWLRGDIARLTDDRLPDGVSLESIKRLFGAMAFIIERGDKAAPAPLPTTSSATASLAGDAALTKELACA